MLDLFPPRPRNIKLTRQQKALLDWANETLVQLSRELFANPQDAPAIGNKYWNILRTDRLIELWQAPERAAFPGALIQLTLRELQLSGEIICLNPEALETYETSFMGVTAIIMKPLLDRWEVVSRNARSVKVKPVPLQNLHIFILPEDEGDGEMVGLKEIVFDEDYQYQMVDPATLDGYFKLATVNIDVEIKPKTLREKIGEVFSRVAQYLSHK